MTAKNQSPPPLICSALRLPFSHPIDFTPKERTLQLPVFS